MSVNIIGIFDPNSPLILGSTITLPADLASIKVKNTAGTARNFLTGSNDAITLDAYGTLMLRAHNTASYLQLNDSDQARFILASVARMELTGTGLTLLGADAASGAGNVADSIPLYLRASYRTDPANNLTSWYASATLDMTAGGATPAASEVHAINSVTVLTLTNTNGTPSARLPGTVSFSNLTEGGTGSMNIKTVRQVVNLSGAQTSTTINLPAGAMLLGASFNVDTAVVTSSATNTWDADYTGGSTTNLVTAGAAGAQNTKANKLIVPEVASAETNIEFDAPGAETFSSGAIEVVAYYIDQTSLANA